MSSSTSTRMGLHGLALLGWSLMGGLGFLASTGGWAWLAEQPIGQCYGLGDPFPDWRVYLLPIAWLGDLRNFACSLSLILPVALGLLGLQLRPRSVLAWIGSALAWACYALCALLLATAGC